MRIGLVVDADCDLPDEMIADENVVVLPIAVRIGDHMTLDTRNSDVTRQFMESDIAKDAAEAETIPYTVDQIRELFLSKLVHEYDYVFCQTIASSRSPIYERAVQASFGILNDYHEIRRAAGNNTPFALRVQDTGNLFAGQALPAWDTLRQRKAGESPMRIRTRLERVVNSTQGLVVTPDLYYMRNRGRKKRGSQREPGQRHARHRTGCKTAGPRTSRQNHAGCQGPRVRARRAEVIRHHRAQCPQ